MGYESVTALRASARMKNVKLAGHLASQGGAAVVVVGSVTGSDQLARVFISLPGLKRRVFM
jgi:hypothetical protein